MPVPKVQWKTPDDGQRNCPKHVELCARINLESSASVGFIIKEKEDAIALGVRDLWKHERLCSSYGAFSEVFSELM